ncbi:hypothetical protein HAX54_003685, partial [Datura stramonium]|nr:hypothetical protein [Datura stramonium]
KTFESSQVPLLRVDYHCGFIGLFIALPCSSLETWSIFCESIPLFTAPLLNALNCTTLGVLAR